MSRKRTWCERNVERALRIGFWVKRASGGKIKRPELVSLAPPLLGRQTIPVAPLAVELL
jgi:hypothetical protein